MLSSGLPPLLLVLSVLELSWSLSDEEKKIILDEHNRYRSQVDPPARAMMRMSWDTDLEIKAQAFAEKCIWGRNGDWNGINIIAVDSTQDVKFAIEKWNEERKFYNLATFMCDRRQMCSRYTQVVWAKTSRIGCGAHFCEKIDGIKTEKHLLVCSYYPTGNMKGKKPYVEGPSCSSCPTVCEDKLCENMNRNGNGNGDGNGNGNGNRNGTSVDGPTDGAPSTCLALSLFLLPSATLVGLLL